MPAEAWPEGTAKEKGRFLKLSMVSPELAELAGQHFRHGYNAPFKSVS